MNTNATNQLGCTSLTSEDPRRFLLTGVYSHYHFQPDWDRPELSDDLAAMVQLFTGELGYEHVPLLGLDATYLQTKDALRDFAADPARRPDDYVVLYLAGHGEVLPVGQMGFEHILLPSDAAQRDLRRRALKSADVAEWMLAETEIRRLLLIVDACYSGHGALDFAVNALMNLGRPRHFDDGDGCGVVVITASRPAERSIAGAFTSGFTRAVRHQASAGHGPEDLSIDAVLNVLKADPNLPASQSATWSLLLGEGSMPRFLPNPRSDADLVPLDLAEQARQWQARLAEEHKRADELRTRFVPKSSSFIGRAAALSYLVGWLHEPSRAECVAVTGDPGSGKTAVLGLLASLSDGSQRPTVSTTGIADVELPSADAIDVAIYAGGLSTTEVMIGIAAAAGMERLDADPAAIDEFIAQLLSFVEARESALTVLIDALDEAADPAQLAERVIRPLVERGEGHIRLLLGSRREVFNRLGRNWRQRVSVVDLDSDEYCDLTSISTVIRRTLLRPGQAGEESPFASAAPAAMDEAVTAIAAMAGSSFFVAIIAATTQARLAAANGLPDPHDPSWLAGLPRQPGEAIRADLETRLGGGADTAMELLLPLAYARGVGLPWEDIWALLANSLFPGKRYTNDDLTWLRSRAGSYVVEGGVIDSRSLYRLFHQSLADHMLSSRDRPSDERVIFRALRGHVPLRADGKTDWWVAHPYVRLHLAQHAEAAGLLDELTSQPGYLAAAESSNLLAALDSSETEAAQTAAAVYRRAAPTLRRCPKKDRISYLGLASLCAGAAELAAKIASESHDDSWSARWASWRQNRHHQRLDGHTGWVNSLATSNFEGRPLIVSASDDETLRYWDLDLGTEVRQPLRGHDGAVNVVVITEHSRRPVIISAGDDSTIRCWDGESGAAIGPPLAGHTGWIRGLATAVVRNRKVIVSASDDGTLRVWDMLSSAQLGNPLQRHSGPVRSVGVIDISGNPTAVSASDDGTLRRWNLATGSPIGDPMVGHTGPTWPLVVTSHNDVPLAISGGYDRTVRVWDLRTGSAIGQPLSGHTGAVWCLAIGILHGRPVIASGGADATVRVWDLESHAAVGEPLTGHGDWVNSLTTAELDGQPVIVSGSADNSLRVWDLTEQAGPGDPFVGHGGPMRALTVATLGDRPVVITGSDDTTLRMWDMSSGRIIGEPFAAHTDWVRSVAATPVGEQIAIASGSDDCTVHLWESNLRRPVRPALLGHSGSVWSVAIWAEESAVALASASADASVIIWDLDAGAPRHTVRGHDGPVRAVSATVVRGRRTVVSAGDDGTLRTWDTETGQPVGAPLVGHAGAIWSVATAVVNGVPLAVSGGQDATLRVWDLDVGESLAVCNLPHQGPVRSVTIAQGRDGPYALAGSEGNLATAWDLLGDFAQADHSIRHGAPVRLVSAATGRDGSPVAVVVGDDDSVRTWDLARGALVGNQYVGHTGPVWTVAAAYDGNGPVALTGSADSTIRVWNRFSGAPVGEPLRGHEGPVRTISPVNDGGRQLAVSGGDNGDVRIWDLTARTQSGRPLSGHTGAILASTAITVEDEPFVLTGGMDAEVRMWSVRVPTECLSVMQAHQNSVEALASGFIGGRAMAFSGDADGIIRCWDLAEDLPLGKPLLGHSSAIRSLELIQRHGKEPALVSVSDDGTLRLWDVSTEQSQIVVSDPSRPIQCLCVLPAGNLAEESRLAIASGDIISLLSMASAMTTGWATINTVDIGTKILSMASDGEDGILVTTELGIAAIHIR